jgi:N-acetylglucosaminyldiphosphoundecaprenol N-acetyl-beta-D-mannosaminyltransferase
MNALQRADVLGVLFDNHTLASAVGHAMALAGQEGPSMVCTPNAEMLVNAQRNQDFKHILQNADMAIADGVGVLKAAKILGRPLRERVAGADLAEALLAELAAAGKSLFLYGGQPGIAIQAAAKLREKHPALVIHAAHGYHPPDSIPPLVAEARADVVYVCLGSPKQEFWMRDHGAATGAKLLIGLGGTIDVFAGVKPRAPRWVQRIGFEWLYQAVHDPKRFKRTLKLPLVLLYARRQKREERRHGR